MSSRGILVAVAAVGVAFSLAACAPKATTQSGAAQPSAAPALTSTQPTGDAFTNAPTPTVATPGTPSADPGDGDCTQPPVQSGHKIVYLAAATTATTVKASNAKWQCEPDTDYYADGPAKSYTFAAGAKAELHHENVRKAVSLAELATHTGKCLSHQTDPAAACGGAAYDIVLDPSGKISQITEVWF